MKNDRVTEMLLDLRPAEVERTEDWFSSADEATLLREITTTLRPASRTRRPHRKRRLVRRWGIAMPAVGACAAAAAVIVFANSPVGTRTPLGPPPAQAVSFSTAPNGWIVAKVTDPLAAQKTLDADFAEHHLDITLRLIPVGPSLVGTVLSEAYDSQPPNAPRRGSIQALDSRCGAAEVRCQVGVKIWEGFTGHGEIDLGRAAQPGERYVYAPSVFAPGEVLHCSGLVGAPVSHLATVLQAHGWTVARWYYSNKIVSAPPAGSYISEIFPLTATTVKVNTDPTPAQAVTDSGFSTATLQQGCSGSGLPLTRPFG